MRIEWDDATSLAEWAHPDDIEWLPAECVSCGWVIREDDRSITLAGTVSEWRVSETITIPKGCITRRLTVSKF